MRERVCVGVEGERVCCLLVLNSVTSTCGVGVEGFQTSAP